jgi:TP53 regulating kinase-like protein
VVLRACNSIFRHIQPLLTQAKIHNQQVLLDFGLSYNSTIPEDKAVDLYVLDRAFASAHAEAGATMFDQVLEAYRQASKYWSSTFNRFAEVRLRGRKRAMVG